MEAGVDGADKALITLITAISAGTFFMGLAQRTGVPAIVMLLGGGILLGPEVIGLINPTSLGSVLTPLVSLAVGLILFEAGLTLEFSGYRTASKVIQRLLTIGTLITWLGTTAAIYFVTGVGIKTALLGASLVIVTGPTVILPLLKRIRVIPRVHHILQWEGVLIDPIGVFVAILCFEWLTSASQLGAAADFALRIVAGVLIGLLGGAVTYFVLKKRLAPEHMVGVATLGCAAFTFGLAEIIIAESGLLATIVAGFVSAILRPIDIKRVQEFKAEVADLLIAVLFMVLASRLEIEQFLEFGWRGWVVVAIVMAVIRPLNVLVCTAGQGLNWREKAFLSWLAPRGIVAASMASLFRIMLEEDGSFANPAFVETFTYSVIFSTIIIEGLLANRMAILLKLKRPDPTGWLIIGAHEFSRRLSIMFSVSGLPVTVIDSNPRAVSAISSGGGITAYRADARDPGIFEDERMMNIGNVLALTDNEDLNLVVCARLQEVVGRSHVFAWVSQRSGQSVESDDAVLVWSNLPKPSMLSIELLQHESRLFRVDKGMAAPQESTAIASVSEKKVLIYPEPPAEQPPEDLSQLVVVRSSNHLQRSISPELFLDIDKDTLEDVLRAAFDKLVEKFPKLPADSLVREIVAREQEFPTALGNSVSVPHAYTRHLNNRICCVIRCPTGIDIPTPDDKKVHTMFLVLSPAGDPEGHLAIMAEIAHLMHDPDLRQKIVTAKTASDIYETVVERH